MNSSVNNFTSNSNNAAANKSAIPWLKNSDYTPLNKRLTNVNITLQNQLLPLKEIIFRQFLINSALQLPQQSERIKVINKIPSIMNQIVERPITQTKPRTTNRGLGVRGGVAKKKVRAR